MKYDLLHRSIMRKGRQKWLCVVALLAGLHPAEPAQAEKLTLSPHAWSIRYSQGMPSNPSLAESGWSLDFPRGTDCKKKQDCPGVHYVITPYRKLRLENSTLITKFQIMTQGEVRFNYRLEASNTCSSPAPSAHSCNAPMTTCTLPMVDFGPIPLPRSLHPATSPWPSNFIPTNGPMSKANTTARDSRHC